MHVSTWIRQWKSESYTHAVNIVDFMDEVDKNLLGEVRYIRKVHDVQKVS